MDILTKWTDKLRSRYLSQGFRAFIFPAIAVAVMSGIGIATDMLLPFTGWPNIVRALEAIVGGAATFTLGYMVVFFVSQSQRRANPDYVRIKDRFSPSWRRRIALIVAAVMASVVIGIGHGPAYTMMNYAVVATILAIIMFVSMNEKEAEWDYYGVPDERDNAYEAALQRLREKREKQES